MKNRLYLLGFAALLVLMLALPAFAAEEVPEWRKTWNMVWKYINFLILAFVVFKFGRGPIKQFVHANRLKHQADLENMQGKKAEAEEQLAEIEAKLKGMDDELKRMEVSLIAAAKSERNRVMELAAKESQAIMERGKTLSELALNNAKRKLTSDMLDTAADMAAEKLKKAIGPEDQARLFEEFAQEVQARKSA